MADEYDEQNANERQKTRPGRIEVNRVWQKSNLYHVLLLFMHI